ncbi:MAG: YCF48-related protein [Deferrisomatales bacterium]|nr:YCF48-related protein [Deferrisomatales bacterium]
MEAERLVQDGADKPFLDLAFVNEQRGFVVGAYGIMFRTEDGGRTWEPWMDRVDNPRGMHLNAIHLVGNTVYLAGEQGLFLRSTDGGERFIRLKTPYEGTYFTMAAGVSGEVLLAGLRGNAYWSTDQGDTFQPARVVIPVSLSAVAIGTHGTYYFANQAGFLLASHDGGRTIVPLPTPHLPPVAALLALGPDELLTVGVGGALPVSLGGAGAEGGAR